MGLLRQLSGKESACNAGDAGYADSIPGLGRSPGVGNGNPLQYSCLGNSTDREAWQATVRRVQSWMQLSLLACRFGVSRRKMNHFTSFKNLSRFGEQCLLPHFMKEGDLRRYEPLIYGKLKGLETSRRLTDQGWNKISLG